MSNHTPGPWTVYNPISEDETYGIDAGDGFAVVWYGQGEFSGIRRVDDARLIAAAPDMADALKEARESFVALGAFIPILELEKVAGCLFAINAALDKAGLGES